MDDPTPDRQPPASDPTSPDRPAPDTASTDAATPNATSPDRTTPDTAPAGAATPTITAPERTAPDPGSTDRYIPDPGHGARRHDRSGTRNTTAIVLILVGVVLLAGQGFGARLDNWWALFILIPAFGSLSTAWRAYQASDGELNARVTGPGVTGAILLVVAAVFLFGLDWSLMSAVVLILIGAGMLWRRST